MKKLVLSYFLSIEKQNKTEKNIACHVQKKPDSPLWWQKSYC